MFDRRHYVPILKWKQGEQFAVRELDPADKASLTPLIEVMPASSDEDDVDPRAVDQLIEKAANQLETCWGTTDPIFVDLDLVQDGAITSGGAEPIDELFRQLSAINIQAIPVCGPDRATAYNAAVSVIAARDGRGACIRLRVEEAFEGDPAVALSELIEQLALPLPELDLVIDFGPITPAQGGLVRTGAIGLIATLPHIADYRSLTVASGAFPQFLSAIQGGTIGTFPRTDWTVWRSVMGATLPRAPTFGDYTAAHPYLSEIDPRYMQTSASIRYCDDDEWIIFRGFSLRNPYRGGHGQYNGLSGQAINHASYSGSGFSWGDGYIDQCANGGPTGNPMKWRQVATNRHLVYALRQIANIP